MDLLFAFQIASAVLVLVLVGLTALRLPRAVRAWSALGVAVALIAVTYVAEARLLGHPRPSRLEFEALDARVLSVHMVEKKAIHVWVLTEAGMDPLSLSLPWDEKTAREMREAQKKGDKRGTGLRMRLAGRLGATEDEPVFYSPPPQAPPPKRGE